ncbi:MAG: chromosome segregation protein SMC [Clostridiales bacterium]|nr:chromosome segregation protein SMC [Clostridiales bacterium]
MYLKKLELQGFKSFPEYTLIEFDRGMTAVVGPNGSGKSNVTDAVRWVLGEQSVKSLRGGKMEDVIFNGTSVKKAMNYAEVTMTLDNSDKYVDTEYTELEITRRLYRSGESEYQINKVNCRLKDITNLFFDTGLGKDGYSIVGQGRVDEILSPKSEDRRRVIEEAAGITKYKARKDEAERKLASTEQNLLRIDDRLNSLAERVGPLKEQSEKAAEYHRSYELLKQTDMGLLVRRINDANQAMGDYVNVLAQVKEEIKTQEDRYLELRNSNSELTTRSEQLDEEIENKRQELSDLTEIMHELSSEIKVDEQKVASIKAKIELEASAGNEINEDIARLTNEYKGRLKKADELLDRANEQKDRTESLENEREKLIASFKDSEKSLEELRQVIEEKNSQINDAQGKINTAQGQITTLVDRIKELTENRKASKSIKEELDQKITEAEKLWRQMMEKEGEVTSDIQTRQDKLTDVRKEESELLDKHETLTRTFLQDRSKLQTLKDLESRKAGYQESVGRLMDYADKDPKVKKMITGIIGDLISVDSKYTTAVEIALGSAIHNVVTPKEQDAADLIRILKDNRMGRVTFLPIENIRGRDIDSRLLQSASREAGFIDVASNLVKNDKKLDDIVSNLLGRIIICEDMDSARSIARAVSHQVKIITLEGDSINAGGSLTGGSVRKDSVGVLGRADHIKQLEKSIIKTEQELGVLEAQRQEVDSKIGDIEKELGQLDVQLKYFSVERAKAEAEYRNLGERRKELDESVTEGEKQLHEISSEKLRLEDDIAEYTQIIKEINNEITDVRENIGISDKQSKEFNDELDRLRDRISESKTTSEKILAERNGVLNLASHIKEELESRKKNLEDSLEQRKADAEELDAIITGMESKRLKGGAHHKQFEELSGVIKTLSSEKEEIDGSLKGFFEKQSEVNDILTRLREKENGIISKNEKHINDIDMSKNRLWEDYEVTYDNIKDSVTPAPNINEAVKTVTSLKNKIKALGPVNLNSIEEYREVSSNYEFISSQRDDIMKAKTDLEKVISDLLSEMKEQFIKNFTTINENFKTVFTDLFNGGSAEILLSDADDVLNCAIEIKAQPPGKKLQSLTLLSGGERCLTAIALLFAILQLRPSPFVILDEVEAALDDVNVSRFTDFVRRYTVKSQFILVTHRKGTMEACDRMYGVTMAERGISKILSMRIGD